MVPMLNILTVMIYPHLGSEKTCSPRLSYPKNISNILQLNVGLNHFDSITIEPIEPIWFYNYINL